MKKPRKRASPTSPINVDSKTLERRSEVRTLESSELSAVVGGGLIASLIP